MLALVRIMKEIEDFITKLKEERTDINQKLRFVYEHKFEKEGDYLRNKIQIINTILNELESVVSGHTKGIEVKFSWLGC